MNNEDLDLITLACEEKARGSFYSYRQYISDFKLKTGWFVREVSKAIEDFYIDYESGKRPILIIQAPPQHGKSEVVTDGIAWMAGKNPSLRFIYASFSERLGVRANLKLQRTITRPKYKGIFPDLDINAKRTVTSAGYQRNKEMVEFCDHGGSFRNTTVRGSITGETLDIGVIDDPIKGREEANSETVREKTWNWFTDDFSTRFDEMAGMIIILTRWHVDDPVGRLLEINKNIKLLSYKAIAEEDEANRLCGDALFPEHKSIEFLTSRKNNMPAHNWESLYQQNPSIPDGNIFKSEWWKFYEYTPDLDYRMIYADTAMKAKESNDYSALQHWGVGKDKKIYLLDQLRGKWEAPELLSKTRAFWNKSRGADSSVLRMIKIEDKASGTGLIQMLGTEGIPVRGIPRSIDKVSRMNDGAPQIEAGNVVLPKNAPFLLDYLREFELAPNGVNDDQIDPTLDAISDMLGVKRGFFIG